MKTVKVIITKQAGETGLRLPGTPMFLPPDAARIFVDMGLVKYHRKPKAKPKKEVEE